MIDGMPREDAAPPYHQADDDALAQAARHNRLAFGELYERHHARVYRYIIARVGDVHQAQDLTAQTFLAALEGIAGYAPRGRFAGWLLTIAHHKIADHFRRRRSSMPLESAAEIEHPDPPLEHVVANRLQIEQVARALQALPPERAEALALRIFSGLSVAEVARTMGKSEAAVKMLVYRAVRDVQAHLAFGSETAR